MPVEKNNSKMIKVEILFVLFDLALSIYLPFKQSE